MSFRFIRYKREVAAALAWTGLLIVMSAAAPGFFAAANARDLIVNNAPVLIVAIGITLVILSGEIDISVGSQFAVCSVLAGWLARSHVPMAAVPFAVIVMGGLLGAVNGVLVAVLRLPSIIVTLATFVVWADALRWVTQGAWVQDLPPDFQWFGLSQNRGELLIATAAAVVLVFFAAALYRIAAGRAIYAVGCDREAARLNGIEPRWVVFFVFVLTGALVGLGAVLNAVRFTAIPSNLGTGLELKVIAAAVVGGTAITGGRGTLAGTLIGVMLLGSIGTALTFAGINPFWEKAIQGAMVLAAVVADILVGKLNPHGANRSFRAIAG